MFEKTTPQDEDLNKAIDRAAANLADAPIASDDYATILTNLERLHALKTPRPHSVSPDTLVTVGAHLLGIAIIVGHERAHVVTSKALGFLSKLR